MPETLIELLDEMLADKWETFYARAFKAAGIERSLDYFPNQAEAIVIAIADTVRAERAAALAALKVAVEALDKLQNAVRTNSEGEKVIDTALSSINHLIRSARE